MHSRARDYSNIGLFSSSQKSAMINTSRQYAACCGAVGIEHGLQCLLPEGAHAASKILRTLRSALYFLKFAERKSGLIKSRKKDRGAGKNN